MRNAMQRTQEMQKVDLLDTLSRNRMEEKSRWMQAIIQDELQQPLHVRKEEKFPNPYAVESGMRREMERIHAHEVSVLSMEQALTDKERLRRSKVLKARGAAPGRSKKPKPRSKPRAHGRNGRQRRRPATQGRFSDTDPKRLEHFGRLAAIKNELSSHRNKKTKEVLKLIRIQRDAPLLPAETHSVDHQVKVHSKSRAHTR